MKEKSHYGQIKTTTTNENKNKNWELDICLFRIGMNAVERRARI